MTQPVMEDNSKSPHLRRFLIGQLGSFGDCLYATAVARQIKADYPDCHLTWAIGTIYRSVLDGNPHVDEVWEYPIRSRSDLLDRWQEFEEEAMERKARGDFDEIFLTQVLPGNVRNFDGTLRASIFRAYNRPVTVPVTPVLRLSAGEVENVRKFADAHHLAEKKDIILFECSPLSGQSFVTMDYTVRVAEQLFRENPDVCMIISSGEPVPPGDDRIIDGSELSFRENAELSRHCTLLVGCSSGISWLCTSDWAKRLPMVQLLKKETYMYASFVHDHEYFGLPTGSIIEMTDTSPDILVRCIHAILTEGFETARQKYHERIPIHFRHYAGILYGHFRKTHNIRDVMSSLKYTAGRWLFNGTYR